MDIHKTPYLNHNSKFLIMTTRSDQMLQEEVKIYMKVISILNPAIIYENSGVVYAGPKPLNDGNILKVFSNPLENLKGQEIKVFVFNQIPTVTVSEGQIQSSAMTFMRTYAEKDNLMLSFQYFGEIEEAMKVMRELAVSWEFEMSLNAFESDAEKMPKLMTYEESGYCVIVPYGRGKSYKENIFLKVRFNNIKGRKMEQIFRKLSSLNFLLKN